MKKVILFIIPIILLGILIGVFYNYNKNEKKLEIYSVKTLYSYLANEEKVYSINVYANKENSLLNYVTNCEAFICTEDEKISIEITNSHIDSLATYEDSFLYKYVVSFKLDITMLQMEDCFLEMVFPKQIYTIYLGDFEIVENKGLKHFTVMELAGLSFNEPYLSLAAIEFKYKNDSNNVTINNVYSSNLISLSFNEDFVNSDFNKTNINDFFDYHYKNKYDSKAININANESLSLFLPITYKKDIFIANLFFIIEINGTSYYYENFNYINTNDLNALKGLIHFGSIENI